MKVYLVVDKEFDAWDELLHMEIPAAFGKLEDAMDYIRSIDIPMDVIKIDYVDDKSHTRAVTYIYGNIRNIDIKEVEMKL